MTKVLMVTHSLTPDKRIDQMSLSLIKEGYEVYLVCTAKKKDIIPDFYKEINVVPLNIRQRAYFPFAVHKARKLYKKIITRIQPDIIHANDVIAANIIRKIIPKNTPFVYDEHEVWELLTKMYADRIKGILRKLRKKYIQISTKYLTRKILKQADLVIFVNEYWVDYYANKGFDRSKIISVENYPLEEQMKYILEANLPVDEFFTKDPRKKIVHSSKFVLLSQELQRNVENIVQAVEELDDWVLVVFGPKEERFENRGVVFIPAKPRFEYLASCKFCQVALNPIVINERNHYCSPNRFYEFVKIGLRVFTPKAKTFIEKFGEDALIWVDTNCSKEEIKNILVNIEQYPTGKELQKIAEKFQWEKEVQKVVDKYANLLSKK
ncbi:MAG: glycosyltransferase [Candidatus Heimdallarchaeota archaeon]|nr:glycosyltransferase [Candidatus Heimdallarchaeota archaeon]